MWLVQLLLVLSKKDPLFSFVPEFYVETLVRAHSRDHISVGVYSFAFAYDSGVVHASLFVSIICCTVRHVALFSVSWATSDDVRMSVLVRWTLFMLCEGVTLRL